MRALVIDDSRAMRLVIARILKELGYEFTEAANGREGLDRLREGGAVDLVLVDWNMPEINGYDFVCQVRAEPEFNEVRIIMVTTETELAQVSRALEAGADEYIMKPFTRDVILGKLEMLGVGPR